MKKITLPNGEIREITDEQYEKFIDEYPPKKTTTVPFRAERGGYYFFINDRGGIERQTDDRDETDDYFYLIGNYYETDKEAEHASKVQKAISIVTHAILKANDGWVPDWSNENKSKYYIVYAHYKQKYKSYLCYSTQEGVHKLPYIKDEAVAQQIIKNYRKELDLIFGV